MPYEIDLEVNVAQEEKFNFIMFLLHNIVGFVGKNNVDKMPEEFRKFFKIANQEGSAKEVN